MPEYDQKEKEAYKTLKLPEGASQAEIKRQYRKLAKQHHTDVSQCDDEGPLKEINPAYEP